MSADDRSTKDKSSNRRQFLLGATLGTAGAVVAVVSGKSPAGDRAVAVAGGDAESRGYRMTAHIQRYYDTTKI
ncbi:MAG: twin-arginine translocation signal domain-containing protein [Betaproteobacteria bacterium]|nr:twin-arginine translocation signal domain-containing protein [Betaproteobacteria bacterium]